MTDGGGTANGGVNTVTRTFIVAVAPANQAPVVTTTAGSLTYIEGQAAVAIDPGVTVTDADSTNLVGATVAITNNFAAGQDVLAFINQVGHHRQLQRGHRRPDPDRHRLAWRPTRRPARSPTPTPAPTRRR